MNLNKFFEQILNEAKYAGQIGYHFCTDNQLIHNCLYDCIDYNPYTHDNIGDNTVNLTKGVSLTRDGKNKRALYGLSHRYQSELIPQDFSEEWDEKWDETFFKKWRISIDLGKLSENYQIKPVNDLGKRFEAEERVKGSIFNLHKYIISIDYIPHIKGLEDVPCGEPFTEFSWDSKANKRGPLAIVDYIDKWHINSNFDWQDFADNFVANYGKDEWLDHQPNDDDDDVERGELNDFSANAFIDNLPNKVILNSHKFMILKKILGDYNPNLKNRRSQRIIDIILETDPYEDNLFLGGSELVNNKWKIKINLSFKPRVIKNDNIFLSFNGLPLKTIDFSNLKLVGSIEDIIFDGCFELEEIKGLDLRQVEINKPYKLVAGFTRLPSLKKKDIKYKSGFLKSLDKSKLKQTR